MVVPFKKDRLYRPVESDVSIRIRGKLSKMKNTEEEIERFSGDGLSLRMYSNYRVLEVTGDGCRITLVKNCGSVRVVGDGCRLRINHNTGDIVYTGDGGHVLLGPESSRERVKYVGDGGKVTFDTDPCRSFEAQKSREQKLDHGNTTLQSNPAKPKMKLRISCSTKSSVDQKAETSISPEAENLRNEKKEAMQFIKQKLKDCRESDRTVLVPTNMVPRTQERSVNKWIVGPVSVVSSIDNDGCSVKIISKRSGTTIRAK